MPDACVRPAPVRTRALAMALGLVTALAVACGGSSIESRLAEVHRLQDETRFAESVQPLREILADEPDHPEANMLLGVAMVQTGQPSLAIWPLEKASRDSDFAVSAGLLLASTAIQLEGHDDALRALDRVLEVDPERTAALSLRAQVHLAAGRTEAALADTQRLIEIEPESYSARLSHGTVLALLGRLEEAETVHLQLRELADATGSPATSAKACMAVANFYRVGMGDAEESLRRVRACADEFPTDPFVLTLSSDQLDGVGEAEEATALWARAVELAPDNLGLYLAHARRLARRGEVETAEQMLLDAEERFGTAKAWPELAHLYRSQGRAAEAVEAIDTAVAATDGGSEELRFMQADLLVDAGDLERARQVNATLAQQTYRQLIEGRLLLAEGDEKGALAAFESAIQSWPTNAGARYFAGVAAFELGRFDLALTHLREALRADKRGSEAALIMASIYQRRGEYELARSFATNYLENRNASNPRAHLLLARSQAGLGAWEEADATLDAFVAHGGRPDVATFERAAQARARSGPEAAVAVVRESGLDLTDPAHERALRSLLQDLSSLGRRDEALAQVDRALAAHPGVASFHEMRGTLLALAGRSEEARAEFEQALALAPEDARALAGLGSLTAASGDLAGALEHYDRAAASDPSEAAFPYASAQLLTALDRGPEARQRLEDVVRRFPGHVAARNDLAWMLAEEGEELDRALELAQQAERLSQAPRVIDTLGWVHLKRGDSAAALAAFERAAAQSDDPTLLYHLALAQKANGDPVAAIDTLERALDSAGFEQAAAAERELTQLRQQ